MYVFVKNIKTLPKLSYLFCRSNKKLFQFILTKTNGLFMYYPWDKDNPNWPNLNHPNLAYLNDLGFVYHNTLTRIQSK